MPRLVNFSSTSDKNDQSQLSKNEQSTVKSKEQKKYPPKSQALVSKRMKQQQLRMNSKFPSLNTSKVRNDDQNESTSKEDTPLLTTTNKEEILETVQPPSQITDKDEKLNITNKHKIDFATYLILSNGGKEITTDYILEYAHDEEVVIILKGRKMNSSNSDKEIFTYIIIEGSEHKENPVLMRKDNLQYTHNFFSLSPQTYNDLRQSDSFELELSSYTSFYSMTTSELRTIIDTLLDRTDEMNTFKLESDDIHDLITANLNTINIPNDEINTGDSIKLVLKNQKIYPGSINIGATTTFISCLLFWNLATLSVNSNPIDILTTKDLQNKANEESTSEEMTTSKLPEIIDTPQPYIDTSLQNNNLDDDSDDESDTLAEITKPDNLVFKKILLIEQIFDAINSPGVGYNLDKMDQLVFGEFNFEYDEHSDQFKLIRAFVKSLSPWLLKKLDIISDKNIIIGSKPIFGAELVTSENLMNLDDESKKFSREYLNLVCHTILNSNHSAWIRPDATGNMGRRLFYFIEKYGYLSLKFIQKVQIQQLSNEYIELKGKTSLDEKEIERIYQEMENIIKE